MALQSTEQPGKALIPHAGDEIEIDTRIRERAPKPNHERKLLRRQIVAVSSKRCRQVGRRVITKLWIRHRLFRELLQHVDANAGVVGSFHGCIVLVHRCYCLSDRDCTSLARNVRFGPGSRQ